jgi:hypothetical protein
MLAAATTALEGSIAVPERLAETCAASGETHRRKMRRERMFVL